MGGAYFFSSYMDTKNIPVILSASNFAFFRFREYTIVPANVKKMWGVEGGVHYIARGMRFAEDDDSRYKYRTETGGEMSMSGTRGGHSFASPAAMTTSTSVYAGGRLRRITNLRTVVGNKLVGNQSIFDFYFDVMYAPTVTISDVVATDGTRLSIVPNSGSVKKTGWRLGVIQRGVTTLPWLSGSIEMGKMPGPSTNDLSRGRFYFSGTIGIALGFNKLK